LSCVIAQSSGTRSRVRERNVIIRPHGPAVSFVQLDDLEADRLQALPSAVFLILEISPGNFQGMGRASRHRGQGFRAAAQEGHRSRCDCERRNACRRQRQFQGQIRAGVSARGDPPGAFIGALPGDGTFQTFIKSPNVLGDVALGVQLYRAGGFEVKAEYAVKAGNAYLNQTGSLRAAYHF
jgi:hypothetical protein